MMSMDHNHHNAVFFMFMDRNASTLVAFFLIYVAYHVMFYSVVEILALYIKSIMIA